MVLAPQLRLHASSDLRAWVSELHVTGSVAPEVQEALYPPRAEATLLVKWNAASEATVSVVGPLTRARRKSFSTPPRLLLLRLRAGSARAAFGVPVHLLADQVLPLGQLWGAAGRQLEDALCGMQVVAAQRLVDGALLPRLRAQRANAGGPFLAQALQCLDEGAERVSVLAEALGCGERRLRRLFQDELGMSPKRYARIARLRRALHLAASVSAPTRGDAATGFYDQSHRIREFRALLQLTPEAFARFDPAQLPRLCLRPRVP